MATVTRERLSSRHVAARREPIVPRPVEERPLWQVICLLYAGIILLAAIVMTLAFSVAGALA